MHLIDVIHVSKTIGTQAVLKDISCALREGEKLVIGGATGSGKSTLLKIIAGLIQPDAGEARFRGKHIPGPLEKLIPGHPSIAYLSQHFELRNNYRVEELLEMANKLNESAFASIIDICRIGHLLSRRTDQLSGGEKQRIATARLLLGDPELLLLDEPYSNLDLLHRQVMKEVIRDISRRDSVSCILVSHDPADTLNWADRLLVIRDGQWVQEGSPEALYRNPSDAYVAGLLGPYILVSAEEAHRSGLLSYQTDNALLYIRPEEFRLVGPGEGARAVIDDIRFAGPYTEVHATWNHRSVTFFVPEPGDLFPGQEVWLRLAERKSYAR
jgi:iron(III) transport system ATP-binding protein